MLLPFALAFTFSMNAQQTTVTGQITSTEGVPLPGATVLQKGTTNGAVADFDGNYSIELVQGNQTLTFSYVGFSSKDISVQGRSVIDVILEEDAQYLDEVVIIGYGSQKKTDITGSVSSVASEDLEKAVFNTVDQLLQGRSSGVVVSSSSGEPGASSSIRIRGNNSISGNNEPLYVVDGIPITGTPNFNPTDIESLEVLKDASATAIYGSRGANGVILVTTKRGKSGKTKMNLNFDTSVSSVVSNIDVLNGRDYAEYRNEATAALGLPTPFPNPAQYEGQGFNWQEEILGSGFRTNVGLSVMGGSENVKYFVSTNYLSDNGIIKESDYNRGNVRANIDVDAFDDKLELNFGLNLTHIQSNRAVSATRGFPEQLGPVTNALLSEPLVPSLDYSGFTAEGFQFYNPYLEVTEKDDRSFNDNILFNTQATLHITDELSYVFNGGINFRNDLREIFYPSTVGQGILANGDATRSSGRAYDYIVSNYFNYENTFGDSHDFSATLGMEYSEFNNYAFSANVSNFDLEILGLDNLSVASSRNAVGSGRSLSVLQSGFLRMNYAYKGKYLLTLTGRADGSSRFAENEKWGYFPSAAVGWRVSEENFLKNSNTVSNLKLRASYGETGSQAIAPYQSLARYGTVQYPIGNSPSLAFVPTSVANPNLRWETTEQLNLGLDLGVFKNRFNLTFDYFKKTTRDLLQFINIPSQSGFSGAQINFGSIRNEGLEIDLNLAVFQNNDFNWDTSINYTSYKNTVVDLGGTEQLFGPAIGANFIGGAHLYRPGAEFGEFFGLVATGLIQQSDLDEAEASGVPLPALNNDRQLGHWKFKDLNGDGVITSEDREIIGNPNPDFFFGWNNDFRYKNLSLNIFIQGSYGNDILNSLGTILNSGFQDSQSYKNQTLDWYQNRWTPQNPTNDIRYPSLNSPSPQAGNYMVEDGSYIRLKNVSLRYDVPIRNSFFSRIQMFVTGTNLITITDYSGFDPEVSSLGSNTLAPGVDLGVYPRQKTYTLGFNFEF